jgi:ATP-dependent DNA ligase
LYTVAKRLRPTHLESELESLPKARAAFIEPMLLLRAETLPDAAEWLYELKFDGYRALAIKTKSQVQLRSRNENDFTLRYPAVAKALAALPDDTVIDGEVVALDESGRTSFNILQNYGTSIKARSSLSADTPWAGQLSMHWSVVIYDGVYDGPKGYYHGPKLL